MHFLKPLIYVVLAVIVLTQVDMLTGVKYNDFPFSGTIHQFSYVLYGFLLFVLINRKEENKDENNKE